MCLEEGGAPLGAHFLELFLHPITHVKPSLQDFQPVRIHFAIGVSVLANMTVITFVSKARKHHVGMYISEGKIT